MSDGRAVGALNRALRSADPQRRQAAIRAFSQRGGADSVTSLRWVVESDSTPDLAGAALEGMARLGRASGEGWTDAIDALVDLTALGTHRAAATGVLAAMPPGRVARISDGLAHPNPHVRRATIETLTRMKHPEASARVRSALDDGDEVVREAAVIALDRVGARGSCRNSRRSSTPTRRSPCAARLRSRWPATRIGKPKEAPPGDRHPDTWALTSITWG